MSDIVWRICRRRGEGSGSKEDECKRGYSSQEEHTGGGERERDREEVRKESATTTRRCVHACCFVYSPRADASTNQIKRHASFCIAT